MCRCLERGRQIDSYGDRNSHNLIKKNGLVRTINIYLNSNVHFKGKVQKRVPKYVLLPSSGPRWAPVGEDQQTTLLFYNYFVLIKCYFYNFLKKKKYHTGGQGGQEMRGERPQLGPFSASFPCKDRTNSTNMYNNAFGSAASEEGGLTARGSLQLTRKEMQRCEYKFCPRKLEPKIRK